VTNLGPGRRIALWVQGCSLGCPGCMSPSMQDRDGGRDVDVRTLAEGLAAAAAGFDGLTISGGEPFQQYGALMALCSYYKALCPRTVLVYTGYRIAELERDHPERAFHKTLDYLIDGRYLRRRHDGRWRGSTNQRLYRFLTGQAVECNPWWSYTEKTMMLSVPDALHATMAGIPERGDLARLRRAMRSSGIKMRLR